MAKCYSKRIGVEASPGMGTYYYDLASEEEETKLPNLGGCRFIAFSLKALAQSAAASNR